MAQKFKYRDKLKCLSIIALSIILLQSLPQSIDAQTRDPRFYSRVGVDYQWPNPGDPDYRWVKAHSIPKYRPIKNAIFAEHTHSTIVAMDTISQMDMALIIRAEIHPANILRACPMRTASVLIRWVVIYTFLYLSHSWPFTRRSSEKLCDIDLDTISILHSSARIS